MPARRRSSSTWSRSAGFAALLALVGLLAGWPGAPARADEAEPLVRLSAEQIARLLEPLPQDPRAVRRIVEVIEDPRVAPDQREKFLKVLPGVARGLGYTVGDESGILLDVIFLRPAPEVVTAILHAMFSLLDSHDELILKQMANDQTIELFNYLHDNDPALLESAIAEISPRGVYLLLAEGRSFYTWTFELLWNRFREAVQQQQIWFGDLLDREDPERRHLANYILTLGGYRQLDWLFRAYPEVLGDIRDLICADANNLVLLSNSIEALMTGRDPSLQPLKPAVEGMLLSSFTRAEGDARLALGLLLQLLEDDFSAERRDRVASLTREFGKVGPAPKTIPYERLINSDGVIELAVSFESSAINYLDVLKRLLVGADERFRDVGGYAITSSTRRGFVAEKAFDDFTVRVTAGDARTIAASISEGRLRSTIVSSRSHSAELQPALSKILSGSEDLPKLIIPGACGSFKDIPLLSTLYPNAQFILTNTQDQGDKINLLLYFFLEGLGKRLDTWQDLRDDMKRHIRVIVEERVFPDDISQALLYLMQRHKTQVAALS